jgi:hypothetical protein
MKRIEVEYVRCETFGVVDFLRAAATFAVCRERHCWPPLPLVNAFLEGGRDDDANGTAMRWRPFELSHAEYGRAVAFLDPGYRIDGLGVATADWRQWFERAAALPQ